MPADGAGGGAGRVEQHGVERLRLPLRGVGLDDLGAKASAAPGSPAAGASRGSERSTAVTCAPALRKLRGLAARRGAQIGDGLAAHVAEKARRQRGGGVLHPPCAVVEAGQLAAPARCEVSAHGAGRQHSPPSLAAQPAASSFTVRSSAGSRACAAAMARAVSSP